MDRPPDFDIAVEGGVAEALRAAREELARRAVRRGQADAKAMVLDLFGEKAP